MTAKTFMTALGNVDDKFILQSTDTASISELFAREKTTGTKHNKKIKIKRLLIAAIIAILLIAITVSVTADIFRYSFPEGVITIEGKGVKIHLLENPGKAIKLSSADNEYIKKLNDYGIPDIALPTEITENWQQTGETEYQVNTDSTKTSSTLFVKGEQQVIVHVDWYESRLRIGNSWKVNATKKGEMLTINGLSVHILYHGTGRTSVVYVNNHTIHNLIFEWTDYEKVKEIMQTIAQ